MYDYNGNKMMTVQGGWLMFGERLPGSVRYQGLLSGVTSAGASSIGVSARSGKSHGGNVRSYCWCEPNLTVGLRSLAEGRSQPLSKHHQ